MFAMATKISQALQCTDNFKIFFSEFKSNQSVLFLSATRQLKGSSKGILLVFKLLTS